jgi:hypothetical protein
MAIRHDITTTDLWFRGEDKRLQFVNYASGAKAAVLDASGYALSWQLSTAPGQTPIITKTTGGGGITVSGIFNADPALNTQVIEVAVADTDTDGLTEINNWHELKRTDAGLEGVITHGKAAILVPVHLS